jgi:hypothetical protein
LKRKLLVSTLALVLTPTIVLGATQYYSFYKNTTKMEAVAMDVNTGAITTTPLWDYSYQLKGATDKYMNFGWLDNTNKANKVDSNPTGVTNRLDFKTENGKTIFYHEGFDGNPNTNVEQEYKTYTNWKKVNESTNLSSGYNTAPSGTYDIVYVSGDGFISYENPADENVYIFEIMDGTSDFPTVIKNVPMNGGSVEINGNLVIKLVKK